MPSQSIYAGRADFLCTDQNLTVRSLNWRLRWRCTSSPCFTTTIRPAHTRFQRTACEYEQLWHMST